MKTPILQTPRLTLRPINMDDAPALQRRFNNWNIIKHLSTQVPWPYPDDGAETFIKSILNNTSDDQFNWAITERKNTSELIGAIGYGAQGKYGNRGFWLDEPFQNRGYMTEAVIAVNNFVFNTLKIDKFIVTNLASNTASRRIKEKTGALFIKPVKLPHHNGEEDGEMWEMRRKNWLEKSSSKQDHSGE